jgi:myo-inositol-1(or 4)-monophosphatase
MNLREESTQLRETARSAALSVGDQLTSAFRTTMDKGFKRDLHDIVTVHDKASEARIVSVIMAAVPDSTIIGEEGGETGTGRVHWYVDPIDGTSNFSRGIALWCVSIAAVVEGRVVAGVIYNPVAGEVFSADLSGAWLNEKPLQSRACTDEVGATIVSSFPNARDLQLFGDEALAAHGRLLTRFQAIRNLGSAALCLAHVAAGWADATMGFSTSPWDVAAGILILEQAGGTYSAYSRGAPSSPNFLAPDFIGTGCDADYPTLRSIVEGGSASYQPD